MTNRVPWSPMALPNGCVVNQLSRPETELIYREVFVERCYLPPIFTVGHGDVIVDVGAHIGLASLFFLRECPGSTLYAVEPAPVTYGVLVENLAPFGSRANTSNEAVSSRSGVAELTYYPRSPAQSGLHAHPVADAQTMRRYLLDRGMAPVGVERAVARGYVHDIVSCPVVSLSELMCRESIAEIDVLKLDCEGSELDVLLGVAPDDWPRIRQIAIELEAGPLLHATTALLEQHGMHVTTVPAPVVGASGLAMVYATRERCVTVTAPADVRHAAQES